jgi:ABC-type transporter Mla subunit MlaD
MESGQEAKDLLDGLDEELDDNLQELQTAVEDTNASNILNTVSTVTTTLGAMAQQISSAFQELDQIDASNELEQAFEEADSCDEIPSSQR